ncbi:MAG: protein translocase subunit SecF [Gammaproteobacteria bacterium]|nr:protein translocase subunit SecF [Gammaproteobacteria bacterium]
MFKLLKENKIDFMSKRKMAIIFSVILLLISSVALVNNGLNFGIDFTGGTLVEVGYPESADLVAIQKVLDEKGFTEATVVHFGTTKDVLIRVAPREGVSQNDISSLVLRALKTTSENIQLRRSEYVGPQVGDELTEQGGLAMLYALIGILVYVALRFEYRFSIGSVSALIHDVLIVLGFFAVTQVEFDLSVLAAVLAVIGYSLNDTIVVYDRIRENFRKMRKGTSIDIMNTSINQTLSRTLVTSLTTLLVLLALFFLGGEVIHSFSIALIVGVVVGTYSSIYVASTVALQLGVSKVDLMPVKKEGTEFDAP